MLRQAPNGITILRIILAPVLLGLLLGGETARWWAAGLFLLGMLTDGLDGAIARKWGLVSRLGIILDPIADKALTAAGLLGLVILGELPWWVLILIFLREGGITLYRLLVVKKRPHKTTSLTANWGGKVKTISQVVAIGVALLPLSRELFWLHPVNIVLMTLSVVITWLSGLWYVLAALVNER